MPTISGTVYDHTGAAAAGRIVRVYRRDTGAFLGSATSSDGNAIAFDEHYASVPLLMHMDGSMDYDRIAAMLPDGVEPGYDQMEVTA